MKHSKDSEDKLDIYGLLSGFWLLAHDLADKAIHSVSLKEEKSFLGRFLKNAHHSEKALKELIKSELSRFGLATKEDVLRLYSELEKIRLSLKSKRG